MSKEHFCYECDSEFTVEEVTKGTDLEQSISFCPFCGSEMDFEEDEDDLDEEFYEDDE
jgi:hypothetical protein